jgi:NTP pyrophosphatase (non-canonical NTP hydrolase)
VLSTGPFSIGSDLWPGTSKLIEEMGELTQVLGKLIAIHGATDHWDGSDLRARLHEELGDVRAALSFFTIMNELDHDTLNAREAEKLRLFYGWQLEHGATEEDTDA